MEGLADALNDGGNVIDGGKPEIWYA